MDGYLLNQTEEINIGVVDSKVETDESENCNKILDQFSIQ